MSSVLNFSKKQGVGGDLSLTEGGAEKRAGGAHVIAIASGKGGVGKTSLSTNISIALKQMGHKVCLFDADTGLANVNILLNIHPRHTLEHFVSGNKEIDDILLRVAGGIEIVPGASGIAELLNLDATQQMRLVEGLRSLESCYDYLIVDTSAGVNDQLLQFLAAAPHVVLTITQEPTSLTDAFSVLKVMKSRGIEKQIHVIVNMAQNRHIAHDTFKRFKGAVAKYLQIEVRYLGFVFSDAAVSKAVYSQHPFLLQFHSSLASRCVQAISQRLVQMVEGQVVDEGNPFSNFFRQVCEQEQDLSQVSDKKPDAVEPLVDAVASQQWSGDLKALVDSCTEQEYSKYLLESLQAWVGQYQRFPQSLKTKMESWLLQNASAELKTKGAAGLANEKSAPRSGCDEPVEDVTVKQRSALLAACRVASMLGKRNDQ